jgi:predicted RNA-binding protein with RPS1 domain
MKRIILLIMTACIMTTVCASAQMQGVPARTYTMNQGLVHDLEMMTGIMSDINTVFNRGNISIEQQQQAMSILGRMGVVMQQMAATKEVEGWQQSKQHRQLYDLKKQLEELKKQIEGK